ncbi:hypothetical protein [Natranaeroarchaeum sulfidigenes]|uniref:Uncharacterized protein n=1 Tax=Natranaeroarchaeum sulfidigenes TaxID=2784880 RepID=A0A897MTY2_9EURY|nr:hypothetical protein [Natranaeroarchaeum sulfidigenes]QSG02503.1 hypothetical protein AArcS_1286 [Natranaeroarchaeum sulfidigenes]
MTERYDVNETRPAVSYGPVPGSDRWALSLTTEDGERVDLGLGERAMYDLWIEVRGVPSPRSDDDRGRSIRQLVHYANSAKQERIEEAIDVLVGGPPGDRP